MRALAAAVIALTIGTGCIGPEETETGFVDLYWDFVRDAPAQPGGQVTYDTSLTGTGNAPCTQSGVETVTVIEPLGTFSVACVNDNQQGVQIALPYGPNVVEIQGYKTSAAGVSVMVFDSYVTVVAPVGGVISQKVDVEPVTAPFSLLANLLDAAATPPTAYGTCSQAGNPTLNYSLYDSAGTLIDQQSSIACPGTTALPLSVLGSDLNGTLDLDAYTIKMQGTVPPATTPTFDACSGTSATAAFENLGLAGVAASATINLYSPPQCTE